MEVADLGRADAKLRSSVIHRVHEDGRALGSSTSSRSNCSSDAAGCSRLKERRVQGLAAAGCWLSRCRWASLDLPGEAFSHSGLHEILSSPMMPERNPPLPYLHTHSLHTPYGHDFADARPLRSCLSVGTSQMPQGSGSDSLTPVHFKQVESKASEGMSPGLSEVDKRARDERQDLPSVQSGPGPGLQSAHSSSSSNIYVPSVSQPNARPSLSRRNSQNTSRSVSSMLQSPLPSADAARSQSYATSAAVAAAISQNQGAKRPALKVYPPQSSFNSASDTTSSVFGSTPASASSYAISPLQAPASAASSNGNADGGVSAAGHGSSAAASTSHRRADDSRSSDSLRSASSLKSIDEQMDLSDGLVRRRLWFRKKSCGSATSLIVSSSELVDDVKTRILQKYPNSLQQKCDPADLVMTLPQPSGIRLELQPDENVIEVMDRFFPDGMRMNDALEVGPAAAMWSSPLQGVPNPANNRTMTPRTSLQRARSYSNTHNFSNQPPQYPHPPPPAPGTPSVGSGSSTPTAVPSGAAAHHHFMHHNHGSPGGAVKPPSPTQEHGPRPSHSPTSEHSAHSTTSSTATAPGPSALSPASSTHSMPGTGGASNNVNAATILAAAQADAAGVRIKPKRTGTSVLLLPRKLPAGKPAASERYFNLHNAKLVPITGNKSPNEGRVTRRDSFFVLDDRHGDAGVSDETTRDDHNSDDASGSRDYRTPAGLLQLQQQLSPSLHISQGKPTVVPQINILIVEDNPVNQRILEVFMQRRDVRYDVAKNGREALEKWKVGGFHLILMDIQLPVMTGLEATTEIRRLEIVNGIGAFPQAFKDSKEVTKAPAPHEVIKKSAGGFRSPVIIVALTASSDSDDKSDALAAGCNDFLTKPVNLIWLEKKIIEWGCMQALIDFDGWKKWSNDDRDSNPKLETAPSKSARRSTDEDKNSSTEANQTLPRAIKAP